VALKQQFQMLSGTLKADGKTYALKGKVLGDKVSFSAGGRKYEGRFGNGKLELK
jgi:hypothetical protein